MSGLTINEQSLRVVYSDAPAGQRIEVFRRYEQTTQNFLVYRRMLIWALAAAGEGWGRLGPLRFYARLGTDDGNFYHYQAPLPRPPPSGVFTPASWLPERLIDLNRWILLRAFAEELILRNGGTIPGDTALVVWDVDLFPDGDSTYAVVISDQSRPPNLAAVRQITLGVFNPGSTPVAGGEIWIDDIRLDRATDDNGYGTRGEMSLLGSDLLTVNAAYNRRDPYFRQLGEVPTYQTDWGFTGTSVLRMEKFMPARWGVAVPFEFGYANGATTPVFLPQTDVLAEEIPRLRTGSATRTNFGVGFAKVTNSRSGIMRATLDGLRLGYNRSGTNRTTTLTQSSSDAWSLDANWQRTVADRSFPLLPGFMKSVIDALPGFIRNSAMMQNLRDLRFRWTPRALTAGSTLADATDRVSRFTSPQQRPSDAAVVPQEQLSYVLQPLAGFELQPFPSLAAGLNLQSTRDLVPPSERNLPPEVTELVKAQRSTFLGMNVGWETGQSIATHLDYRPKLSNWFDVELAISTAYSTVRSLSYVEVGELDTTLVRDMRMSRTINLDLGIMPPLFLEVFGIPNRGAATGFAGGLREVWDRLQPVQFRWNRVVNASFDRQDVNPALSDKLVTSGLSGLRISSGDTASSAGSNYRFSVGGGYRFPLSLDADLRYSRLTTNVLTVRSDRDSEETEWPNASLRWRAVPIPGFVRGVLNQWSITGTYRKFERQATTTTQQNLGEQVDNYGLTLLLVFPNGVNLSYRYDKTSTQLIDATGVTGRDLDGHEIQMTGTLRPPPSWGFLNRPLRVSLEYTRNGNTDCRGLGGTGFEGGSISGSLPSDCTPHTDQLTQHAALTVDSDFVHYSLGLQFSWDRRSSEVGAMQRVNQFNFNVFGRFSFLSSSFANPPLPQ